MMEFTYEGMVRWGFGFHNPNHAAALLCAAAPFLWRWRRHAWAGWLLMVPLAFMLALTYSRSGLLVLVAEMLLFQLLQPCERRMDWRWLGAGMFALLAVGLATGLAGRFRLDGSVVNRPRIWWAGLRLCAANPFGVGTGHSGRLVSAFLLPSGIEVRTLVNSHLTLLAEWGVVAGLAWFAFILLALGGTRRHPRTGTAFAGLVLSACTASVFDWPVLADLRSFGDLGTLNFVLSWLLVLFFLALGLRLVWRRPGRHELLACAPVAAALAFLPQFLPTDSVPRVRSRDIVQIGVSGPLVLYGGEWELRQVAEFCPPNGRIALRAGRPDKLELESQTGEVWLFGTAAELACRFPKAGLVLISPPEYLELPQNTVRIYARRFRESYCADCEVVEY